MNDIVDARKQRTELRLQLFRNGFTPLPNKNKMCLLKGWSRVELDAAMIENEYPIDGRKSGRWRDTGIRCGDLIALDFDIDDADLLNDLLDVLVAENVIVESPFVRIGRAPREMWVYRMVGPKTSKRTTGGFTGEGFGKLQVEVLGIGSQFGAYGKHSDDIEYSWPNKDLLDHDITELPAITLEQVDAVIARSARYFEEEGLLRLDNGAGTLDGHYSRVFDLTPDMVFPTRELGNATLAEIATYLQNQTDLVLRCTVEALRPSTGGSLAGMVNLVHGMICVSDHGTYTTHYLRDQDPASKLASIADKLMARFGVDPNAKPEPKISDKPATSVAMPTADTRELTLDRRAEFDDNLDVVLERFAYIVNDDMVVDTFDNTAPMMLGHFRNMMMPFHKVEEGERGADKIIRVADAWVQNPDRLDVGSAQMRPDKPWPFYWADGVRHVNTYRPNPLPATGDASIGLEFFDNLLPIAEERAYVLQWLSYKLQHPGVRGPAIIMVANAMFGTGRGSLGSLLTDIFHERYVSNVDFSTLTGKTYQSQYNEWLVGSLVVVVNEAADNDKGNGSRWDSKNAAYEHLKNIVDPANTRLQIVRKGLNNFQAMTFASVLVMTNHADALVIPEKDRRFYIVENGAVHSPEYWARFHAWREDPANVGALVEALLQIDLTGYNPYEAPPMTRAKAEMIYAGASELDRAVSFVLDRMPGKLMVREQVYLALERYLVDNAVLFPEEWKKTAERVFHRLTQRPVGAIDRIRLDGKQHSVRQYGAIDAALLQSPESMLEEVQKNGPTIRQLSIDGNVVALRKPLAQGQSDGAAAGTTVGS